MRNLLDDLNPEQQRVVKATHGPVLVLAGAGSGKTRALTYRVAYLLQQKIAKPQEILAVTFTNKAAGEMKDRVRALVAKTSAVPSAIGTFHGLGARMLREQARYLPRTRGFIICDADDSERLVRMAMKQLDISRREFSPRQFKYRISQTKNDMLGLDDSDEVLAQVYARYEKLLAQNDAYDFDDLLIVPLRLLEENAAVRKEYQQRWRWLLVDEYQDTNVPQDRLLKLLMGTEKNICVVGDDYQAIYSWRGARVDHILQFEKVFPQCTTVYLTRNYRSTPQILEAAGGVIQANRLQKHKRLWTKNNQGAAVQLAALPTSRHEAAWVRERIEDRVLDGGKRSDCVVLYRTNAQSRQFEEEFLTYGIPYTIVGGYRFYQRREVKDALAFLQFWVTPISLPLYRMADALWRGVGPMTISRWEAEVGDGTDLSAVLERESKGRPVLRGVVQAYQAARQKNFDVVSDLLAFLLQRSGYEKWLKALPDGAERWENVEELLNVTAAYSDVSVFLEETALLSDIDALEEERDRVTCMTLHSSKGLEFEQVLLVGCEDGLLPHSNSMDSRAELEEERRLMYVGMTRAKQQLSLTYAQARLRGGDYVTQMPSRFLESLPAAVEYVDSTEEYGDLLPTPDIIRAELL